MILRVFVAIAALAQPVTALPRELSALLTRTAYAGRVESWCRVTIDNEQPVGFAVALVTPKRSQYAVVQPDARIVALADYSGRSDLACYSRPEAQKLDASIKASETIQGSVTPRWNTTVICGFVEPTAAMCWQYSPTERAFVGIGGWTT